MGEQRTTEQRTCLKCGWVHFGVTRAYAEEQVAKFGAYFDSQPPEVQAQFGRKSSMADYERCNFCGGPHTNFRSSEPNDCPDGCTIGPIIHE